MTGERVGREIEFASDGETARGYLAKPAGGTGPGLVVIQEWWGLVDHVRDVCDRFAREGFVALAPDLYRGESTADPDTAGRLMLHAWRIGFAHPATGADVAFEAPPPPAYEQAVDQLAQLPPA